MFTLIFLNDKSNYIAERQIYHYFVYKSIVIFVEVCSCIYNVIYRSWQMISDKCLQLLRTGDRCVARKGKSTAHSISQRTEHRGQISFLKKKKH